MSTNAYTLEASSLRRKLDAGQNHAAFEEAQALLDDVGGISRPQAEIAYLAALSAARGGALTAALDILRVIKPLVDGRLAAEVASLWGRIAKQEAAQARDPASAHAALQRALEAYQEADRVVANSFARINAASMAYLLQQRELAHALALSVLTLVRDDDPWAAATRGEANLLLGEFAQARTYYQLAWQRSAKRFGDIASMRQQLRLLAGAIPEANALLSDVPGPAVVAFSGHMIDAPERSSPRFPAHVEPAVVAELGKWLSQFPSVIGYAQAANGADILFCEALLAKGHELNLILPFAREDFIAQSVVNGGPHWLPRFEYVMARATSITYAIDEKYLGDDVLFQHASDLIEGMTCLRAEALAVAPQMLVIADEAQAGKVGGTLAALAHWRASGRDSSIIDLGALRAQSSFDNSDIINTPTSAANLPPAPTQATPPEPTPPAGRQIKALMFADVNGFSRLREEHFPQFFEKYWGLIARLLKELKVTPEETSQRGDGIYAVFNSVVEAAQLACALVEALETFDWSSVGLAPSTRARIALHAGPVFVSKDPINGQRIHVGTHVTRVAHIEPIVAPGQILTTEAYAAVLSVEDEQHFACDFVGIGALAKGFGDARLYRLRRRGVSL